MLRYRDSLSCTLIVTHADALPSSMYIYCMQAHAPLTASAVDGLVEAVGCRFVKPVFLAVATPIISLTRMCNVSPSGRGDGGGSGVNEGRGNTTRQGKKRKRGPPKRESKGATEVGAAVVPGRAVADLYVHTYICMSRSVEQQERLFPPQAAGAGGLVVPAVLFPVPCLLLLPVPESIRSIPLGRDLVRYEQGASRRGMRLPHMAGGPRSQPSALRTCFIYRVYQLCRARQCTSY